MKLHSITKLHIFITDAGRWEVSTSIFLQQTEEPKEDFSHLPPQQQKKKLQEQIDFYKDKMRSKTSERGAEIINNKTRVHVPHHQLPNLLIS